MATEATQKELSLRLTHTFDAPREKVFRAWTDPAMLKQWFGPPGYEMRHAEVDLRVGGQYRLGMVKLPEGEVFYKHGTYREVRPPERLVYTWQWERPDMDFGETLVTVEFLDRGRRTEVVLTHELFPNAEVRERHNQGWQGCFGRLAGFLAAGSR